MKLKKIDIPARLKFFTLELQKNPPIFVRIFLVHAFTDLVCEKKKNEKKERKHVNQKQKKLIY